MFAHLCNAHVYLKEFAAYVQKAPQTLANWRSQRHPARTIPFVRIGGQVFYRRSALDTFLEAGEREGGGN